MTRNEIKELFKIDINRLTSKREVLFLRILTAEKMKSNGYTTEQIAIELERTPKILQSMEALYNFKYKNDPLFLIIKQAFDNKDFSKIAEYNKAVKNKHDKKRINNIKEVKFNISSEILEKHKNKPKPTLFYALDILKKDIKHKLWERKSFRDWDKIDIAIFYELENK